MIRSHRSMLLRLTGLALALVLPAAAAAQTSDPPRSGPTAPIDAAARPSSADLQGLRARIDEARAARGADFARLEAVRGEVARMDLQRRGRWAATMPLFVALGPEALLPMLDALLTDAPLEGGRDRAMTRRAWRVGMLQAVAELRDPVARPALLAILDAPAAAEPDDVVRRAAAEALGALGGDVDVAALRERMARPGAAGLAAIAGLGHARRADAAKALADALADALEAKPGGDEPRLEALLDALGRVGNAFAWRLPHLRERSDGARTRDVAAAALLEAYVRLDGDGRARARRAFLMVDAPAGPALLREARARHPRAAAALDALAARAERNPLRR